MVVHPYSTVVVHVSIVFDMLADLRLHGWLLALAHHGQLLLLDRALTQSPLVALPVPTSLSLSLLVHLHSCVLA